MLEQKPLVSVIMPVFNSEAYLEQALRSVIDQTYSNWELIAVDDKSTDSSLDVLHRITDGVSQHVVILENGHNMGVSETRKRAIAQAIGRFIAYLDSDDAWFPEKLERQLSFMLENDVSMCFTSYETVSEDGSHRNYVHVPQKMAYNDFLKNTITCSHTIVFDLDAISKALLMGNRLESYDYPEDLATWLRVLKTGVCAYGLDEVLAINRKRATSRSSNKLKAVRRTWNQYIYGEGLSYPHAMYSMFWQMFHAVLKRL